jgi:hypothetical protein
VGARYGKIGAVRTVRPLAGLMTLWRGRAGALLSAVVVLQALILVYARTAGAHARVAGVVWSASTGSTEFLLALSALEVFLIWRVWRGGPVAWTFLLILMAFTAGKTSAALVSSFGLYGAGLLVLLLAQVAFLVSPAVRARRGPPGYG